MLRWTTQKEVMPRNRRSASWRTTWSSSPKFTSRWNPVETYHSASCLNWFFLKVTYTWFCAERLHVVCVLSLSSSLCIPLCSCYGTTPTFVVRFLKWRSACGQPLSGSKPWSQLWGRQKRTQLETEAATSRRWSALRTLPGPKTWAGDPRRR